MSKFELEFSEQTLGRAMFRAWEFLLALRYPSIWSKLHTNGLTVEMIEEVNGLLDEARKEAVPTAPIAPIDDPTERGEAARECASLDEIWLTKYVFIARRICRSTTAWLFADLTPQVGQAESLGVVEALLTRLDTLEHGKAPEGMDPKVLDALAASGLTSTERKRVAKLLKVARGAKSLPETVPTAEPNLRFLAILQDIHVWWKAASGIARTAGLKRGELIRLGLAKRQSPTSNNTNPDEPTPVEPDDA